MTAYLTLKEITLTDVNGDSVVHLKDRVLSGWEVNTFIKKKVDEGSVHYTSAFEKISDEEALSIRAKETAVEPEHIVGGNVISAPWVDYVGLHPEEVVQRMHDSGDTELIGRVKLYERGGQNRPHIVEYVAPAERPPFSNYDDMAVQEVWDKLSVLPPNVVAEVKTYEFAHRKRQAIITWEPDEENSDEGDGDESEQTQNETVEVA